METIGPAYGAALESGLPSLVAQLDADARRRASADGGTEPELATPRPDGPLAGLQPLLIVG